VPCLSHPSLHLHIPNPDSNHGLLLLRLRLRLVEASVSSLTPFPNRNPIPNPIPIPNPVPNLNPADFPTNLDLNHHHHPLQLKLISPSSLLPSPRTTRRNTRRREGATGRPASSLLCPCQKLGPMGIAGIAPVPLELPSRTSRRSSSSGSTPRPGFAPSPRPCPTPSALRTASELSRSFACSENSPSINQRKAPT
jgi:hypothetical protein